MRKAVVYDSVTGNTESMAEAIADGARRSGAEVYFARADHADIDEMLSCDVLYLGCPAMGVEMVGDAQTDLCDSVRFGFSGKKVALFGSCAHGEGIWLRAWSSRLHGFGADVVNWPGLMCVLAPDTAMLEKCRELGRTEFRSRLYIPEVFPSR